MNTNKSLNSIDVVISPEQAGERIDKILAAVPEISTRSRALQLIELGHVRLNNKVIKPSLKTKLGNTFQVEIPIEKKESDLTPFEFPLDILHEDKDVLVINKPAGLVVHPSAGHAEETLVHALLHHTKDLSMGFNETRPGIVHRLDKDTSGLLVICKNNKAHELIAEQFKNRTTHRIYWAIVFGHPSFTNKTIENLLGRHPKHRKKFASVKAGKKAITHLKVLKTSPSGLSLIELKLETGRTHQIRVHVSEAGFPIIGDALYGASKRNGSISNMKLRGAIQGMKRVGLHARELGFIHPTTNKEMFFSVPWPKDLEEIVSLSGL